MRRIILILMAIFALAFSGCSGDGVEQLYDTANLEEIQNNREHARNLYQEIIEKYPESEYAKRARERLSGLEKRK